MENKFIFRYDAKMVVLKLLLKLGLEPLQAMRGADELVDVISPADARPVVRGKWTCVSKVYPGYGHWNKWCCSECGYVRTVGWEYTSEGQELKDSLICENCGADMREEENDE